MRRVGVALLLLLPVISFQDPADAFVSNSLVRDYDQPTAHSWMLDKAKVFANLKAPGTFQVDILPITTSRGTPDVTVANSQIIISRVSRSLEEMSNGSIKLAFREVLAVKQEGSTPIRSPIDVQTLLEGKITPSFNYGGGGAVVVGVIIPDSSLGFSGIATLGGSVMLLNAPWSTSSRTLTNTIAHEFGHNLGLNHSGYATCTAANLTSCDIDEYGDGSDFMGRFIPGYVTDPPHLRVSAWHLYKLGILPESAVLTLFKSGTYDIAPAYGGSGIRILMIPVYNLPGYAIEYRPAVGLDSMLASRQLNIPGSNGYYNNDPSYGVQVRVLQRTSDSTKTMLPTSTYGPSISVLGTSRSAVQGLSTGQSLSLPDGSTLSVLSADPVLGARVSLTIPVDSTAPTTYSSEIAWDYADGDTRIIRADDEPEIYFRNNSIDDNRRVASVVLQVNGVEVAREDNPGSGYVDLAYAPKEAGTFAVRGTITDVSGNAKVIEKTLKSVLFQYEKSRVQLRAGKPAKSVIDVWYQPPWKEWKFTIKPSAGTLSAVRKSGSWRVVSIKGLKPGKSISVFVIGVDEYGQSDGGQTLTRRTAQ